MANNEVDLQALRQQQLNDIAISYSKGAGITFTATYQGTFKIHNEVWDQLDISPHHPNNAAICELLNEIYGKANGKVWKGFTSPSDSPGYTNYRLFAQLIHPAKSTLVGTTATFKVLKCNFFEGQPWIQYGYTLKAGFYFDIGIIMAVGINPVN